MSANILLSRQDVRRWATLRLGAGAGAGAGLTSGSTMRLSIIIPARNTKDALTLCLGAAAATFELLGKPKDLEFILIDDASDASLQIPQLLLTFRNTVGGQTQIIHLTRQSYYTFACSIGLSAARGENAIVISHDMMMTPDYLQALLDVAAGHSTHGIIRGCSRHMDGLQHMQYAPPYELTDFRQVLDFSRQSRSRFGNEFHPMPFLIGDSFLVT